MTDEYDQVELLAKVLEYEHALQHAVDPHPVEEPACAQCQTLCQSALDGVNRADFRDIAQETLDYRAIRSLWVDSIASALAEMDDEWWSKGFAGDPLEIAARRVAERLDADGFEIYTYGEGVTIRPHMAFHSLMGRFQRPRFVKPDVYERQFAERIVDEIHGAGLEIRSA